MLCSAISAIQKLVGGEVRLLWQAQSLPKKKGEMVRRYGTQHTLYFYKKLEQKLQT